MPSRVRVCMVDPGEGEIFNSPSEIATAIQSAAASVGEPLRLQDINQADPGWVKVEHLWRIFRSSPARQINRRLQLTVIREKRGSNPSRSTVFKEVMRIRDHSESPRQMLKGRKQRKLRLKTRRERSPERTRAGASYRFFGYMPTFAGLPPLTVTRPSAVQPGQAIAQNSQVVVGPAPNPQPDAWPTHYVDYLPQTPGRSEDSSDDR